MAELQYDRLQFQLDCRLAFGSMEIDASIPRQAKPAIKNAPAHTKNATSQS